MIVRYNFPQNSDFKIWNPIIKSKSLNEVTVYFHCDQLFFESFSLLLKRSELK